MNVAGTAIAGGSARQIDGYLKQLSNVESALASEVNNPTIPAGTGLATGPPPGPAYVLPALGTNFFTYTAPSAGVPASLAVTAAAAAGNVETTDTLNPGDNDVAAAIANLSGGSADQAYGGFVSQVGSNAQSADSTATTQQALTTAVSNQRQSVEGVDLSQEETNVIQEQQAYQASASVMNAFNTMIGTLLGMVGVS